MTPIEILLGDDHTRLNELLNDVFISLDGDDPDALYGRLDLFWARLAMHIRAEHLRLFPAVIDLVERRSDLADVPDLIDRLRHDHDFFMRELSRAMTILRKRENEDDPASTVRGIVEGVKDRLKAHDQIEEQRIYTLATTIHMAPITLAELSSAIKTELGNLPPRFGAPTES